MSTLRNLKHPAKERHFLGSLPAPTRVRHIVFSDFDETLYPHDSATREKYDFSGLEQHLLQTTDMLFGWVSGSNIEAIVEKANGYIRYFPHFIASSLGTEIHWCEGDRLIPDNDWLERLHASEYTLAKVDDIVLTLFNNKGIVLTRQASLYQAPFKQAFYYAIGENPDEALAAIEELAAQHEIAVKCSRTNPLGDDPPNAYNVEFIPKNCGKAAIVEFVREKYDISKDKTYAFGDSCNDLEMLKAVGHGYLLANAEASAKDAFSNITKGAYCEGIREVLLKIV